MRTRFSFADYLGVCKEFEFERRCFKLISGEDNTKPNMVELTPSKDLYVVTGCNKDGEKIKLFLGMIHMNNEDMHPVKQYGLAFIKKNENGQLYKCQIRQKGAPNSNSPSIKSPKYSNAAIPKSPRSKCHWVQLGLCTTMVHKVPNNPYHDGN
jgi:hypothetical protein